MSKCDFRTLRHSIAVSWLSWLACKMISLAFFNALWLSWYTFRSSTNRPCVLFTIQLPGSLILYPWLCWSSIHTGIRWYKIQLGNSYHIVRTMQYLYPSTCPLFTITPDLQSCFPFPHQLFGKLDRTPRYSDPFVRPYHPLMVDFVVCLFVVIKGYCQDAMTLLDLPHDTSVDDQLCPIRLLQLPVVLRPIFLRNHRCIHLQVCEWLP